MVETEPVLWSPCACLRARSACARPSKDNSGAPTRATFTSIRRIQATTGTAAEFFHATAFSPGVHTVALAHDVPLAEKIFAIYRRFYEQYKPLGGLLQLRGRCLRDRIYFAYGGDPQSSFIQDTHRRQLPFRAILSHYPPALLRISLASTPTPPPLGRLP